MKTDLRTIYPSFIALSHSDYIFNPEMFFHFNYLGRQLFITLTRKKYWLKSQNWIPKRYQDNSSNDFWRKRTDYISLDGFTDLADAVNTFVECVYELLSSPDCNLISDELKQIQNAFCQRLVKKEELPF